MPSMEASALKGSGWIIVKAARDCSRFSLTTISACLLLSWPLIVGVLGRRIAVLVESANPFDPVWMYGRAPVLLLAASTSSGHQSERFGGTCTPTSGISRLDSAIRRLISSMSTGLAQSGKDGEGDPDEPPRCS